MSKSIRVTVTRPDLATEFPWTVFLSDVATECTGWRTAFPGNPSYLHMDNMESTTAIVDHVITNDADLETNREAMLAFIPWWETPGNLTEVTAYMSANNITYTISEITAPADVSSGIDITVI